MVASESRSDLMVVETLVSGDFLVLASTRATIASMYHGRMATRSIQFITLITNRTRDGQLNTRTTSSKVKTTTQKISIRSVASMPLTLAGDRAVSIMSEMAPIQMVEKTIKFHTGCISVMCHTHIRRVCFCADAF